MKYCPNCKTQYPEDANFCPQENCATAEGPQRLAAVATRSAPRFEPIQKLGGGSTGEVWRAHDTRTGGEVAYKVIEAEVLGTPASVARAEREFKQLARVNNPKVATIIECEKTPAGGLVVAMELCQAECLEHILTAGPMPLDRAKDIVLQVGQALLEAQKAGLVHRDVAPKNILVLPSGEVKVINFPIAKPINDKVAGVPGYLSPEQVQGKPVDQRSNTYSLAAVLYHMLTGEAPFQAPTVQGVLDMQVSSPVLPPTQRRPGANLPADVDKLILKALDKSSSRRHLTLRLFLNELESIKGQPLGTSKPAGEVGLAKTMMFGGNQADISRMVAEARAAKAAGTVPASLADAVTPHIATAVARATAPAQSPPHAATPAPQVFITPPKELTPSPRVVTPAPVARPPIAAQAADPAPVARGPVKPSDAGKASPPKAGAAFRETLWFKQGDVQQMVADAKAKMQSASKAPSDAIDSIRAEDARPLEERYADDGSVTVEDRKKFSLRSGGTATALPTVAKHLPGESMDEREMVGELSGGRRTLILIVAGVIVLSLIVVVVMMMKGKSKGGAAQPVATPTAVAETPAPPPTPATPPSAPAVGVAPIDAGPSHPPSASQPARAAAPGLGSAGGATKPAGSAQAAKPVAKRKPVVVAKHPGPKHKR